MIFVKEVIEQVLLTHQRKDIGGCICGWSRLGMSFPGHQAEMVLNTLSRHLEELARSLRIGL